VLQPKIAKKFTKTPIFGVQGRSRSSMLVETRDSRLSHSEDFMILSCVVLTQYSSVTYRRTEGRLRRSKDAL